MWSEQGFLRVSIAATVIVAALGVVFGILSGSFSIAFDGVYSLADAAMTGLALWVSSLIVKSAQTDALSGRIRNRFTMGFWHLEPIVLVLNGCLLMTVAVYALINAIINILNGGHELHFGVAIAYCAVTFFVCMVMAAMGIKLNRRLRSNFISLDIIAWIMSGGITLALLIAFVIGLAVLQTPADWIANYVDPVVLALVSLVMIPLPISTVWKALTEILLIAPVDLRNHVDVVASDIVRRFGFLSYRAYVARVGRATQIELYFIVPAGLPPKTVEEWDALRDEIGEAIGDESANRWLTIAFTADVEWAE
ncbi:cation diffusion facilitator family transporter [Rhizobium sp. R72]|uniref:cation diffusion facilitator family transporter n=1 Tax=unclassified Rhizobium TaxID=2613769 RepID=UPI000B538B07|nr:MULTISPECIES: cation transporter [unclassified Rhizobium]OWW04550.1 cation diffusion facilitator family transporter [Rhizobium sp. R72]OWW05607.1 cation diffusion facilitator family transporter [Rhizobium sp. R711]